MPDWFADYARICFTLFGDSVKYWLTFNEPKQTCQQGYGSGTKAPAYKSHGIGEYLCAHNLLKAHARAWHIYNTTFRTSQKGESVSRMITKFWLILYWHKTIYEELIYLSYVGIKVQIQNYIITGVKLGPWKERQGSLLGYWKLFVLYTQSHIGVNLECLIFESFLHCVHIEFEVEWVLHTFFGTGSHREGPLLVTSPRCLLVQSGPIGFAMFLWF